MSRYATVLAWSAEQNRVYEVSVGPLPGDLGWCVPQG